MADDANTAEPMRTVWAAYYRPVESSDWFHSNDIVALNRAATQGAPVVLWTLDATRQHGLCEYCTIDGSAGDCPGLEAHARTQHRIESERVSAQPIELGSFEVPSRLVRSGCVNEIMRQICDRDEQTASTPSEQD